MTATAAVAPGSPIPEAFAHWMHDASERFEGAAAADLGREVAAQHGHIGDIAAGGVALRQR